MSIASVVNDTVTSVSVVNALKPTPPTVSGYSVAGLDDTALDPAGGQTVQINGTGFLAGATITFDGSAVAVVTYVSPNQLTFTSPAKSAGTYTIYVVNPDGGTAIYIPGIIYSLLPTWTTSAGTLGSYYETTSISNTVVASGDAPITYSLFSGSLPTGATLASNGAITGSAPADSGSTTYSFTIQATDAQLQDSTRSFSLTINTDVVTWVSPANATTYTSAVDSAIANVTLSATDAAGYSVTYSANALPTGLSLSGANISGTPTVIADSSTLLTATAATTNRTATRTINWSITVANDPYFEYNTLLIPGASTTFVDDASTNNFAVTIAGDTKPNSFNPYSPGYYSNYFAGGASDYLTASAASSQLNLPDDFTVECWVYDTGSGGLGQFAWSTTGGFACGINAVDGNSTRKLDWRATGSAPVWGVTGIIQNTWNHVAYVRSGSAFRMFLNGKLEYYNANLTTSYSSTSTNIGSANNGDAGYSFKGYISNFRVVKGTAVYTTASTTIGATIFTPSTTPLTAIANTALLTCQNNRYIDTSTNALAITANGNTTVNSFQPFTPNTSYSTYGSGYFDGSGDYLSIPDNVALQLTADFTIEFWIYTTSLGSTQRIIVKGNNGASDYSIDLNTSGTFSLNNGNTVATSTGSIRVNSWNHVALTRSGTSCAWWINGVSSGTFTYSNSLNNTSAFWIGQNQSSGLGVTGYITDVRIVKGTAVYTATFTPPSQPLTAIANTSLLTLQNNQSVNNSVFLDNSSNNFLVTRTGNSTQGTFSPYGGNWSNYFDGSGDWLELPTNSMVLGSNNFTFEAWIFPIETSHMCVINGQTNMATVAGSSFSFNINGDSAYLYSGSSTTFAIAAPTVTRNVWSHIAYVRTGGTFSIYLNGTRTSTTSTLGSSSINTGTYGYNAKIGINGGASAGSSDPFSGYISNLRGIIGSGGYDATQTTITVPTTTLTTTANTALLTCQSNRFIDNSTNAFAITVAGNTNVQRFSPFNPSSVTPTSYSGYFDGTGDFLVTPANAALTFGTGDLTLECWIYQTATSVSTYRVIFGDNVYGSAGGYTLYSYNNALNLWKGGSPAVELIAPAGTITLNVWNHIAWTRSGSSNRLFINGTQVGSTTSDATNYTSTTSYIGASQAGTLPFAGYISNVRIVKGTAVYTSAFTPSTTPLTAISGTSLLTCQSPTFIDNSTNNFTLTAAGNSQPTIQNPFGYTSTTTNGYSVSTIGGSSYFDGTGDYIDSTLPAIGTNNFTIEYYSYLVTHSGSNGEGGYFQISGGNGGINTSYSVGVLATRGPPADGRVLNVNVGGTNILTTYVPPLNTWFHTAIVRQSNVVKVYINGTLVSTPATISTNLTGTYYAIGGYYSSNYLMNGYISDFRLVNGTALYTSNFVPPSQPLTAVQNTTSLLNMTSAGIYDASMMNDMETVGDAKLSTAVTKFGGSSMYFDGTGDYLMIPTSTSITLAGDFTIECWLYINSTSSGQPIISFGTSGSGSNLLFLYNTSVGLRWYYSSGTVDINQGSTSGWSTGTWYHIAAVRSGSTLTLYRNGISLASGTTTQTYQTGSQLNIGGSPGDTVYLNGYIDDLRITKGYARYTSNFTPPTSAFPIY